MGKGLLVLYSLVLILTMMGCTGVRGYKFTKERVDVEVAGNQGVIYGPIPASHKVEVPTRELYGVDIELATAEELGVGPKKKGAVTKPAEEDKTVYGNAGIVSQVETAQPPAPAAEKIEKPEKIK